MKILNELRPSAEGFAGIPQETRIIHSILLENEDLKVTGLLNSNNTLLGNTVSRISKARKDVPYAKARAALELAEIGDRDFLNVASREFNKFLSTRFLKIASLFGKEVKIHKIDMKEHSDFLWRKYFAKTLPLSEFQKISQGEYAAMIYTWRMLQTVAMLRPLRKKYTNINTKDYDVFISQTPWPGRVSPNTQIVVRYHDAIPMFYPHTIQHPFRHQFTHYFPLKSNVKQGAKILCNSENSRNEFLRIFPGDEKKTHVIPCAVSDNYQNSDENPSREQLRDIIRGGLERLTAPSFLSAGEERLFYDRVLRADDLKYIMMVSTIEPRKNHSRLIAAWNALRHMGYEDLKLVLVGTPGWHVEKTLESMQTFQQRGLLFNISKISAGNLRRMFKGAEAVVCPSIAEGFDLSGIEAMLSGGVVAASDIPVHREVYGDGCTYFNPYSTDEAVQAIQRLLDPANAEERETIRARGEKFAQRYRRSVIADEWHTYIDRLRARTA